jgi:hypothetical protein
LQQKGMSFTRWAMAEEQGYALRAKRPGGPSIGGSPPATLSVFRACLFPYCVRVFFAGGKEGSRSGCVSKLCLSLALASPRTRRRRRARGGEGPRPQAAAPPQLSSGLAISSGVLLDKANVAVAHFCK